MKKGEFMSKYISASQINLYRRCPYKYYLNYIEKVPITVKSDALTLGSTIHEFLEQDIYDHEDEQYKKYLNNALDLLKEINDIEMLGSIPKNELKLFGKILGNRTVGIIDKCWPDQQIALDWKSGSLKHGWDQVKRKQVIYSQEDYCLQSFFYKELYNQNHDEPLKKFYFAFLGNNEWWTPKIGNKKFGTLEFDLWCENIITETLECLDSCLFGKCRSRLCNYCDFRYVCSLLD